MRVFQGLAVVNATFAVAVGCPCIAVGETYDNQTLTGTTTISNGSTATVINNLTLDDAQVDVYGTLDFRGINTLGGTGRVNLFGSGQIDINQVVHASGQPQELTVLGGVEIVGNRMGGPGTPNIYIATSFSQDKLINYGVIASEGDPSDLNTDLYLSNNFVINHGTLVARSGSVFRANVKSGWENHGVYKVEDGGLFNFAQAFDPTTLGTLVAEGSGEFSLSATLNNTGNTWTITDSAGPIRLLQTNTINGGTIVGNGRAKLFSDYSAYSLTRLNLNNNVVLDIDVDITGASSDVYVTGGLTINRDFLFNADQLNFNGAQTLAGSGNLILQDRMNLEGDLTIASGMTVSGNVRGNIYSDIGSEMRNEGTMVDVGRFTSSANNATLHNLGTVRAESRSLFVPDQTLNEGLMIASGSRASLGVNDVMQDGQMRSSNAGRLVINGGTNTVNGSIAALGGGQVWLTGSITNNGVITADSGILLWGDPTITGNNAVATNSVVALTEDHASNMLPTAGLTRVNSGWGLASGAILDNTGRTLNLTSDRSTQWTLYEGAIIGGVIDSPDATPLRVQDDGYDYSFTRVTLDGVEVRAPITIAPDAQLNLFNGAQLLGPISLDRGSILFGDSVTIASLSSITGQGGRVTMVRSLDLADAVWDVPDAIQVLELIGGSASIPGDQPLVVSNGGLSGGPGQTLEVGATSSNFPDADFILRDIDLQIDTLVQAFYTTLGIEGTVTLQDNKVSILGGFASRGQIYRHGELQIADGASLTGNGTIRFGASASSPSEIGLFSTLGSELLIDTGITVVGGEVGLGWLGSDGALTRNLGTLEVYGNSAGFAGLRVIGSGLNNEGVLRINTGGRIDVVGTATLAGMLDLVIDGSTATYGESFTLIDAGSISGTFDTVTGIHLGPIDGAIAGLAVLYDATSVVARVLALGDANHNDKVEFSDFNTLANNYNGPTTGQTWSTGDFDGDGDVTFADFNVLANNYGFDANAALTAASLQSIAADTASADFASIAVGEAKLIVGLDGSLTIEGDNVDLNGFSIRSASGQLITDADADGDNNAGPFQFDLANDTGEVSAGIIGSTVHLDGLLALDAAIAGDVNLNDLVFEYGTSAGTIQGVVEVVPEPSSLVLLALGGLLLARRRRW